MNSNNYQAGRRFRIGLLGVIGGLCLTVPVLGAGGSPATARLESLQGQATYLQAQIGEMRSGLQQMGFSAPVAEPERIVVAQSSRDVASINVRLGQMEEQMRVLNGQVEGLQFQMTQMQTFLQRMQEDYEFRFQQLEGGTPSGKTDAAPQSSGVTPSGGVPQTPAQLGAPSTADVEIGVPDNPDSDVGMVDNPDPNSPGAVQFGTPPQVLGTLPAGDLNLGGADIRLSDQPLDLNGGSGQIVTENDANAQYAAGYDAVMRGDYAFAEDQFEQFIKLFPDHPQAPDATNWLGEALLLRGEYEGAADVLLDGYQKYPDSPRAPDMLLKLGMALNAADEQDTACRTFGEILKRYPNVTPSFKTRLAEEQGKAQC